MAQKRKSTSELCEIEAKKQSVEYLESPEQLSNLLVPLEFSRTLLFSKWPLKKIRKILDNSWIRYQAVRERQKNNIKDFYIDRVTHVNRDGLRFKNSRENSYRSIHKLKESESKLNKDTVQLWLDDLRNWNESIPTVEELEKKRRIVNEAIEELKKEEEEKKQKKGEDGEKVGEGREENETTEGDGVASSSTTETDLKKAEMARLIITVDELVQLHNYGKEVFERVVDGFYAEICAPVNPNLKKAPNTDPKGKMIYIDQIVGVNWLGKPYIVSQQPFTLSLKFKHFRDEKMHALPYREKESGLKDDVFGIWLEHMKEWEEDLPRREFAEQKRAELCATFAEPPKGPPIDLSKLVEGEKSAKHLRLLMEWQRERQAVQHQYAGGFEYPPPPRFPAIGRRHPPIPPCPSMPIGRYRPPQLLMNHWKGRPLPPPPAYTRNHHWQYNGGGGGPPAMPTTRFYPPPPMPTARLLSPPFPSPRPRQPQPYGGPTAGFGPPRPRPPPTTLPPPIPSPPQSSHHFQQQSYQSPPQPLPSAYSYEPQGSGGYAWY